MNAQLKETKNTFALEAGTTNRHQWHKKTVAALQALDRIKDETITLSGVLGGDEHENITMMMFADPVNLVAVDLYNEIGDSFGWIITKENAEAITAAVIAALPKAREAAPVEDNRKTPETLNSEAIARQTRDEERHEAEAIAAAAVDALANDLRARYPYAMADDGKISGYARASKNMKQELKRAFPYVKFSVTSDSFSMGNSISVSWDNGASVKSVDAIVKKYQYYIDKCTDDRSNEARAVSIVLGQAKYVSTSRKLSGDLREQVGRDICKEYGEEYDENAQIGGRWLSDCIYMALGVDITGDYDGVELVGGEYQAKFKAVEIKPATATNTGAAAAHIEEHEHTKKGFMMFMVVLDEKLERDDFNAYRNHAKECGGWYSRAWGSTPGGFAFKENDAAQAFLSWVIGNNPTPPTTGGTRPPVDKSAKFRELADKLTSQIEAKHAPRLENTHKRRTEAQHARREGDRLQRTQTALYGLADLHEAGNVPDVLAGISSKKAVYELCSAKLEMNGSGDYHETDEPAKDAPEAIAIWSLLTPKTEAEKEAEKLADKISALQFSNIAGYFPTPKSVVNQMIEAACIQDYHAILEPSAGSGAICDGVAAVLSEDGKIDCFEVNHTLNEILTAKGYDVKGGDFMKFPVYGFFDRVVMNPPFENLQDIEHIQRAHSFLKEGGRLVAIMSPAAFFRSDKKSVAFRDWFESLGGERIDLPEGSFKESGTGVNSVMVIIDNDLPAVFQKQSGI